MRYIKLDWPRYEKAIDVASSLGIGVVGDDFYWCAEGVCGFVSERMYEQVKSYI